MPVSTAGIASKGGKYFLALRKPGTSIGVKWEFPGGKAEPGETPAEALKREYEEELGLDIEVGELLYEGGFTNRDVEYKLMAFSVTILEGTPVLDEHSEVRWVTPEELKELPLAGSDGLIREHLLSERE